MRFPFPDDEKQVEEKNKELQQALHSKTAIEATVQQLQHESTQQKDNLFDLSRENEQILFDLSREKRQLSQEVRPFLCVSLGG